MAALKVRTDFEAAELRGLASRSEDVGQARRLGLSVNSAPKVMLRKCMSFNELRRLLGAIC